jgi:hypothetical protein
MSLPTHLEMIDIKQQELDELKAIIKKLIISVSKKRVHDSTGTHQ